MGSQPVLNVAQPHQAASSPVQQRWRGRADMLQRLVEDGSRVGQTLGAPQQLAVQAGQRGVRWLRGHRLPQLGVEVGLALAPAQPGQVDQRQRVRGVALQRLSVRGRGLGRPAQAVQRVAEVVVHVGRVGPHGQGLFMRLKRKRRAVLALQHDGTVVVQRSPRRRDVQSVVQGGQRAVELATIGSHLRFQLQGRRRAATGLGQRALQCDGGLGRTAGMFQPGQVVQRVGVIAGQGHGACVAALSFVAALGAVQHVAQVVPHVRLVGLGLQRAPQALLGARLVAALAGQQAQQLPRVRLSGVQRQRCLVGRFCVCGVASLLRLKALSHQGGGSGLRRGHEPEHKRGAGVKKA